jgi:hypothetical protein
VIINNKPIRSAKDAEYFVRYLQNAISWLQKSGRFPTKEAKQEVLKAFEKGISAYRNLEK